MEQTMVNPPIWCQGPRREGKRPPPIVNFHSTLIQCQSHHSSLHHAIHTQDTAPKRMVDALGGKVVPSTVGLFLCFTHFLIMLKMSTFSIAFYHEAHVPWWHNLCSMGSIFVCYKNYISGSLFLVQYMLHGTGSKLVLFLVCITGKKSIFSALFDKSTQKLQLS